MRLRLDIGKALVAALIFLLAGCGQGDPEATDTAPPSSVSALLRLEDPTGQPVDPFSAKDLKVRVFLFTSTECPISNRYAPEIERIYRAYAEQSVGFWLVYPDPRDTPEMIKAHLQDYGYSLAALLDRQQKLVAMTGATVTPEVAVYDTAERLAYRGRIDNLFEDFGLRRAQATSHELIVSLDRLLAGQSVDPARTQAVGCFISDFR